MDPPEHRALANEAAQVYEVVDSTDPEQYYTLGVFESLSAVLDALEKCASPRDMHSDVPHEEMCLVEVRRRQLGWGGSGTVVYTRRWVTVYDEENDEYKWKVTSEWIDRSEDGA